jgi:hypothetical protein
MPGRVSEARQSSLFIGWAGGIQERHRATLGWVRSIETRPKPHIHAALIAAVPLDCEYAAALWRWMVAPHYLEAALVEPYWRGLCGLGYVLKQLPDAGEGVQFSPNLPAFASNSGKSLFRTNSAQRRQQRRIQAQLSSINEFSRQIFPATTPDTDCIK